MNKDDRIKIGINKYLQAKAIGTLNYITGFGKTEIALRIIKRYKLKFDKLVIVLVPSEAIKKHWINYSTINNYEVPIIYTVDAIYNYIDELNNVGLLIVDEIHRFTSSKRHKLLDKSLFNYDYNLGLTGTYVYTDKVINQYFPIVDTITESEALENKWISNYIEYNVPLSLSDQDKEDYIKYSNIIKNILNIFKDTHKLIVDASDKVLFSNDLEVIQACRTGHHFSGFDYVHSGNFREILAINKGYHDGLNEESQYDKNIIDNWHPDNIKINADKFNYALMGRNEIHNNNEVKLRTILKLYEKIRNNTTLIFNESIKFANITRDAIVNTFNATNEVVVYHSDIPSAPLINIITNDYFRYSTGINKDSPKIFSKSKQLDYISELLRIGKYKTLITVNTVNEGLNIPKIDIIISVSGTINPTTYEQRGGRGKRVDILNPNKLTKIINLYFSDFSYIDNNENERFIKSRDKAKLHLRQNNKQVEDVDIDYLLEIL